MFNVDHESYLAGYKPQHGMHIDWYANYITNYCQDSLLTNTSCTCINIVIRHFIEIPIYP